jgi:hypothetical protein
MFTLYVSHDCGISYGVIKEASTIAELRKECDELDRQKLRWYIENESRALIEVSAIHKKTLSAAIRARK